MITLKNVLQSQQESVFDTISEGKTDKDSIEKAINSLTSLLTDAVLNIYIKSAKKSVSKIDLEKRAVEDDIDLAIENYYQSEGMVLKEISQINQTTVDTILEKIKMITTAGGTVTDLQDALIASGIFDEKRALMLSRTIAGTAINTGQYIGAKIQGANYKIWMTAGSEVRKSHQKLNEKKIKIDEFFNVGGYKARYPMENRLPPKERCNCRCTLRYEIDIDG